MTVVGENNSVDKPTDTVVDNKASTNVFDSLSEPSQIDGASESAKAAEKSSKLPIDIKPKMITVNGREYTAEEATITADNKQVFIDSVITGARYKQRFDLFGGKVSVVIRNRTAKETQAMYAYMRHELSKQDSNVSMLEGDMSYVLLVAQVDEINGVSCPEMKDPLLFTANGKEEVKPGWYEDLQNWKSKPEGLTSAIIKAIQLFEYKYWLMVSEANNKNFWNSDTSIAE